MGALVGRELPQLGLASPTNLANKKSSTFTVTSREACVSCPVNLRHPACAQ